MTAWTSAALAALGEVWIVNTRCAPRCDWEAVQNAELDYQRRTDLCGWETADEKAFLEAVASGGPTTFFIHGYDVDSSTAVAEGMSLSQVLSRSAGERPWRLVIWSWPSTRARGRIRDDAQRKAAQSDVQAYYLARSLDRMDAKTPVGLVGHSFGARIICGALEILAGGQVGRRGLPEASRPARPLRAVLIAAAMDNAWLLPDRRNGQALAPVDRMLVTCNPGDRVLRWYPRLYGRGGPEALGSTGPACPSHLGPEREKVEVLGVQCSVGRAHGWRHYLGAPSLRCRLPWYAFLEDDQPE
ncbi:MAG: alpha/beta hydrolase [Pirellulales bacterium]|nr:alpha/beta hydrolase [Pirellulales bacterium]